MRFVTPVLEVGSADQWPCDSLSHQSSGVDKLPVQCKTLSQKIRRNTDKKKKDTHIDLSFQMPSHNTCLLHVVHTHDHPHTNGLPPRALHSFPSG